MEQNYCESIVKEGPRTGQMCSCLPGSGNFAHVCPHHTTEELWESLETPEECPVCHEQMTKVEWRSTCCKRAFHSECLKTWLKQERMGAMCPFRCKKMHANTNTTEFINHSVRFSIMHYKQALIKEESHTSIINQVKDDINQKLSRLIEKMHIKRDEEIERINKECDEAIARTQAMYANKLERVQDFNKIKKYLVNSIEMLEGESPGTPLWNNLINVIVNILTDNTYLQDYIKTVIPGGFPSLKEIHGHYLYLQEANQLNFGITSSNDR